MCISGRRYMRPDSVSQNIKNYLWSHGSLGLNWSFSPFLAIFSTIRCCSVAKLCLTLCNPIDCSTPGFPVLHHFWEFAQTHIHPSHSLSPPSPALNFPSIRVFLMSWLFTSNGQSIGASALLLGPFLPS